MRRPITFPWPRHIPWLDFAPDLNFFQALLAEPVSVILPEQLCTDVTPYFAGDT